MASYIGVSPPEQTGIIERYRYTGDGSTTVFSGNDVNGKQLRYTSTNPLLVFLNGVQLIEDIDFTKTSNTQVTFTTAPASNDDIEMMTFGSYDLQSPTTLRENMGLELSDGQIFVGSGSDVTSKVTPSGDATISNTGAITVASAAGDFSVTCDLTVTGNTITFGSFSKTIQSSNSGNDTTFNATHLHTDYGMWIRHGSARTMGMDGTCNGSLCFFTNDSGTPHMAITNTGDVGIGTTSPTSTVDIRGANGVIQSRGILYLSNNDTYGVDKGSQISLGGTYDGSANDTFFAAVAGRKENSTSGNFQGYLQFSTRQTSGNNERMRITSGGCDGIGQTTPQRNLSVFKSDYPAIQLVNTTTGKANQDGSILILDDTNMDLTIRNQENADIRFDTNGGNERMRIMATGDVGICNNLTVAGNLTINGTTTTINTATLDVEDLNITIACGAANAAAADGAGITVDGAAACLTYGSTCDAWSFNKNLGIGTSNPSHLLHLASTGDAGIFIQADSDNVDETHNPYISMSQDGATNSLFTIGIEGNAGQQITGSLANAPYIHASNVEQQPLQLAHNGAVVMTVRCPNVGIGTTSPATKLHVEDGEITVSDGTTCHQIGTNDSNLYFGNSALSSLTTGVCNVAVGCVALKDTTIGINNTAFGHGALKSNTTGNYNVAIGSISQEYSTTSQCNISIGYLTLRVNEGNHNVAIGVSALTANTTGGYNIAIGKSALADNTIGECNTAIGWGSLSNNTTGCYNTSIGFYSMLCNTIGSQNLAIGRSSLRLNTTGTSNVAIGDSSLFSNTIGFANVAVGNSTLESQTGAVNGNIAIGHQAMRCNDAGLYNVAVGYQAMYNTNTSAGSYNTAHGYQALYNNTTGEKNTAIGYQSMYSNTTGEYNAAIGTDSLRSNTIGQQNVALGHNSLYCNTSGFGQVAAGYKSLFNNTTGNYNVAFGAYNLECNTTGSCNVAIGYEALQNATETRNIAIGYQAAKLVGGGFSNVYIGSQAGYGFDNPSNGQGCYNVAIGTSAALYITYGRYNTFLGNGAGATVVSGEQNVGIGSSTLSAIRDGDFNTALGYRALFASCNSSYNVAVGTRKSYDNTTGQYNVAMGYQALCGGTTASYNIAIGYESLLSNTTGEYNVALGYNTLKCATNSSVNIAIGNGALTYNSTGFYNIAIGQEAMGGCSTQCYFQENVAVGHCAGRFADGGLRNTFIGSGAGLNSSGVSYSVALGGGSGEHNTGSGVITIGRSAGRCNQGGNNIFIGTWAGYNNSGGNITGGNQVIIGAYSGCELTIGTDNVILGAYAANQTTTGSTNVVIGTAALASSVCNSRTVAIGYTALNAAMPQYACTTAVGWSAGQCNTGYENTFIGVEAGRNNLSASRNTALGMLTLCVNTYGEDNTVIRS